MLVVGSPFIQDAEILQLRISNCINSSSNGNGCADPAVRDAFISNRTSIFDYVQVDLFFIDSLLTPSQPNPLIRVIRSERSVLFGLNFGTRGSLELMPYHIYTD
jgi:hypothetical protein